MFLVVILYALFASVFVIAKTGLEYTQPFFFVGIRMFFAGLILLSYQFITDRKGFKIERKDWPRLGLLALFNIYLTNVFEFWGLQYLTTFKTCFIYSLTPFLSALLSYFIFSERMSPKKWMGLLVGFLGFIPILVSQSRLEEQGGTIFMLSWAELAVIAAACCSVYGWILLRQLVTENNLAPVMANGVSMALGGAFSLSHSSLIETWDPVPVKEFMPFLVCATLLIIISNLICYNLYGWLLKRFSATFMSLAGFTTPIFTAIFGWLFLGEVVTMPFYISAVIVFTGLSLFYQEELKPRAVQA